MALSRRRKEDDSEASLIPATDAGRPDVFRYHDYRAFLRDWLAWNKAVGTGPSLRELARRANLATGYLPPVASGSRHLSGKALSKLAPVLELKPSERSYFESLVQMETSDSQHTRLEAMGRMKRFRSYSERNPKEAVIYRYMSRWYHIAIREMSAIPGFKPEPEWIQKHLRVHVPLQEVKAALRFLLEEDFIKRDQSLGVLPPVEHIDCVAEVYRLALTHYHRDMFAMAANSIDFAKRTERNLHGHSVVLDESRVEQARAIIDQAVRELQKLGASKASGDTVFHMHLALFPLTHRSKS